MSQNLGRASPAAATAKVGVELGSRRYDILVGEGLLERAGAELLPLLERKRVLVVSDATVAALHLPRLAAGLAAAGIEHRSVVLPPGEGTKDFRHLEQLTRALVAEGVERRDLILALGGGVIGDLAGFAAAVILRGVGYVQLPTTLLAQLDSSVGGKTAIDLPEGKNLVGAFHQPRLVLADLDTLATLPPRELRAGYAEVVKYGLIDDPLFFAWLEANGPALIAGDAALRRHAVMTACRAKAAIVARDETETGDRALLNLGHTFAHALEAELGYDDRLRHGEAVAIGLVLAFELSERLGLAPAGDAKRIARHFRAVGLPTDPQYLRGPQQFDAARLIHHMRKDKKVSGGRIAFILARGIGRAFVARDVDPAEAERLLAERLAA
jgi:3-dehydroquinate synthase